MSPGVPEGEASLGPQARDRGRLETGGALVAAGSATWLVHSVLMVVGFVAILSISLGDADLERSLLAGSAALLSYLGATVAVLLASFLLGAGLLLYPGGRGVLAWRDAFGRAHGVSNGTRARGRAAGVALIVYGILGILAVALLVQLMNAGTSLDLPGVPFLINALLYNWIVASVVLIAASALYHAFLSSLRKDVAAFTSLGGAGFLSYAVVNAVGVFLLVIPFLILLSNPLRAIGSLGLGVVVTIGVMIELLVVPVIGIVVFSLGIVHGLRLRKLVGGSPVHGQPYPTYAVPPPAVIVTEAPAAPLPYAQPGSPVRADFQPPPPPEVDVGGPLMDGVPPPPPEVLSLRVQSEIQTLERALEEQKVFMDRVVQGFVEGRFDNLTYDDVVRDRKERIADLEQRIVEKRAELARHEGSQGPSNEFENA